MSVVVSEAPQPNESVEASLAPPSTPHVFSTPKLPPSAKERTSTKKQMKFASQSKISVFCRPRPIPQDCNSCLASVSDTKVTLSNGNTYTYDFVFPPDASQSDVYERSAKDMVEAFMREQRSCLLFCYGVSGSGKTFTIEGDIQNPGVVPKLMKDLSSTQLSPNTSLHLSYFEIYQESVFDLMEETEYDPYTQTPLKRKKLKLIEGKDGFIELISNEKGEQKRELKRVELKKLTDGVQIWRQCRENRSVSGTALNEDSSRSHSVFMVRMFETVSSGLEREVARLSIVDLAGSERIVRSKATHEQQTEAGAINNSLIMLSEYLKTIRVSTTLGKPLHFISYRGSKLTRLFQDTFSRSRSMIRVIVNVNPDAELVAESENALKFGAIAIGVDTAPLSVIKSNSKKLDPFVSPRLLTPIRRSTTPRFNSSRKKKKALTTESDSSDIFSTQDQENIPQSNTTPSRVRTPLKYASRSDFPTLMAKEVDIRKNVVNILDAEIRKQEKSHVKGIETMRLQFEKREQRQIEIYMRIIKKLKQQIVSIGEDKNAEICHMRKEMKSLNAEIFTLKNQSKTAMEESTSQKDKEIEKLTIEISQKATEIDELNQRIESIERQSEEKLSAKEALLEEATLSLKKLELSMQEKIQSQATKFEVEKALLESNSSRLKEEILLLKKKAEDQERRLNETKLAKGSKTKPSEKILEEVKEKVIQEYEAKIKLMEEAWKKERNDITYKQHSEMVKIANKHGEEVHARDLKLEKLSTEYQELDRMKNDSQKQVAVLEEENQRLRKEIENLRLGISCVDKNSESSITTTTLRVDEAPPSAMDTQEDDLKGCDPSPPTDHQTEKSEVIRDESNLSFIEQETLPVKRKYNTRSKSTSKLKGKRGRRKNKYETSDDDDEYEEKDSLKDDEYHPSDDEAMKEVSVEEVVMEEEAMKEDIEVNQPDEIPIEAPNPRPKRGRPPKNPQSAQTSKTTRATRATRATRNTKTSISDKENEGPSEQSLSKESGPKGIISKLVNTLMSPTQPKSKKVLFRRLSIASHDEGGESYSEDATPTKRRRINTKEEDEELQKKIQEDEPLKKTQEPIDAFDFLNESEESLQLADLPVETAVPPQSRRVTARVTRRSTNMRGTTTKTTSTAGRRRK